MVGRVEGSRIDPPPHGRYDDRSRVAIAQGVEELVARLDPGRTSASAEDRAIEGPRILRVTAERAGTVRGDEPHRTTGRWCLPVDTSSPARP